MEKEIATKLILFMLIVASCKEAPPSSPIDVCLLPGQEQQTAAESKEQPPRTCELPEAAEEANLTVNLVHRDFTPEQELKLRDAIERMQIVINSVEFRERILNHEFESNNTFVDNDGLSNREVYQVLLNGREELNGVLDEEIDLDVTLYYTNNSTVGYTYPNTERVWINNKFFAPNSLGKVAGNLVHEWTHKLGFSHAFNATPSRKYSVPYAVGNIIQELVDSM